MKLAVINIKGKWFSGPFLDKYSEAGIEYDFATNMEEFLENYKGFDGYDGVIMHPPLGYHKPWLEEIQQRVPNLKIAFATMDLGTTLQNMEVTDGIPLLGFKNINKIKEYFEKK